MNLSIQKDMKIIRNILGLSQEELSKDMGISRVTLAKMETGNIVLTKTVAIVFVCVVALHNDKLDETRQKLLSVYDDTFKETLSGVIRRG